MPLPAERQTERFKPALRRLSVLIDIVAPHAARKPDDTAPPDLVAEARSVLAEVRYITSRQSGTHLPPLHAPGWLAIHTRLAFARSALELFKRDYWMWSSEFGEYIWYSAEMAEVDRLYPRKSTERETQDAENDEAEAEDVGRSSKLTNDLNRLLESFPVG